MPPMAAAQPVAVPELEKLRAERDVLRIRVQELEAQRRRLVNVITYFQQKFRMELADVEAHAALALQAVAEKPIMVNGGAAPGPA